MLNSGMFTSDTSEWATPQDFFDKLNAEFHFTLDPCATPENAKCGKFYTKEQNGLAQDWTGETVFCNPPYGKEISAWVEKCYKHSLSGECAVMLIPSRTDTRWFHEWVYGKAELRFVKGRLRFNDSKGSAPFPSLVVVYRGATHDEKLPSAQQWIPCNVALPKTEEKVSVTCEHLDIYGKPHRYVCKAYHVDRYTVRADFDYWDEGCDEYCEEDDQYYVLEGWYECIHNWGDYSSVRITEDKVVAWCPLPEPWKGGPDEY